MRQQSCPSCGTKAARGLTRCPSCGAILDLQVDRLADDEATGADVELGRSPSRWWAAGAIVGVVGLLATGAVAAGGGASRAIDTTTTSSSTSSTAADRSTTTRPPRTTTTVVSFTRTSIEGAPLVPMASPVGALLYGVSQDHDELWRIDLATGAATVRRLDGPDRPSRRIPSGDVVTVLPRAGGAVLMSGGVPAVFVPDDPDAPMAELGSTTFYFSVFAHPDPSRLWRVSEQREALRAEVVDLAGTAVGQGIDLPAGYPIGDDGTGGLLIALAGTTYRLGDDGSTARFSLGQPVALNGERIVTLECADTEVRCDLVGRRRADGSEVGRAPATLGFVNGGQPAILSPSGTVLAAYDYGESSLVLISLDDGSVNAAPFEPAGWGGGWGQGAGPLWWVDEQVLCGLEVPGDVRCWADHGRQTFTLAGLDDLSFSAVAFTSA